MHYLETGEVIIDDRHPVMASGLQEKTRVPREDFIITVASLSQKISLIKERVLITSLSQVQLPGQPVTAKTSRLEGPWQLTSDAIHPNLVQTWVCSAIIHGRPFANIATAP